MDDGPSFASLMEPRSPTVTDFLRPVRVIFDGDLSKDRAVVGVLIEASRARDAWVGDMTFAIADFERSMP